VNQAKLTGFYAKGNSPSVPRRFKRGQRRECMLYSKVVTGIFHILSSLGFRSKISSFKFWKSRI